MAFEYTQIEDDIVERLTSYLENLVQEEEISAGYKVKVLPEKEAGYEVGLNKCLIIVAYSDSAFDKPSATDVICQKETVTVLLNIKSSKLRGEFSIHQAVRLIKLILIGFKPTNCTKLWIEKIEMDDRDTEQNFFSYNVTLKTTKQQVEVQDEEELPRLLQVTFREQFQAPQYT